MQEIQKDREDEFVNKDLIKDAIWQFIYMGFEKKATIKKMEGGEFTWLGEKNLILYDQEFEAHLKNATTEFYRKKAEVWHGEKSAY